MTEAAHLCFRGVGRTFASADGPVTAITGVDLELEPGSITAFVGPSGCGKSTLLNIAAGLDTGYDGQLTTTPTDTVRSYMFQSPRLLPWLTAEKNVAFVLEARGVARREARRRAREALGRVGLAAAVGRYPAHLSGGMRQRVALARALVVEPGLMLLDEPFAAVDALTAASLRRQLLEVAAEEGPTVLFVTHNIAEAVYVADRVIVLRPHPGTVVASLDIPLPRDRDEDDPRLAAYAREVHRALAAHLDELPGARLDH